MRDSEHDLSRPMQCGEVIFFEGIGGVHFVQPLITNELVELANSGSFSPRRTQMHKQNCESFGVRAVALLAMLTIPSSFG